ncbi:uncharacterized protein LOC112596606 [Melanaphis sacchari]|uniref:uncharacterized protein LOC112596606 n=1 Tax=Melanaphis sacchari TaxID=742174 RepID=UPI000DC15879|nr:uncharacterized protein LOC112596606 [Melanaphis sacchari]XP_025198156.1 uncharacterized protein LOC112596606 [Melanaphis sacchari]XP_025198158.1 uncharacterized protein LOC112596606 [Melanaphis sacchari]XP_025198159.1 uncharacterized protein LOC112596606 [Melanaphis sacchari]
MNIELVNTKSDNMNIDDLITKSNNMNIDCAITESDNMNIGGVKTESMSPSKFEKSPESESYDIFKQLPLEIITKIVLQLSFNDVMNLKSVSKVWRCVYVNQNEIWAKICEDLNIRVIDYSRCLNDRSRHDSECKGYAEASSEKLFGPLCDHWLTFNHYIMIVKNIKNNDFPTIYIPRRHTEQSYCTDDYIVNINYFNKQPIHVIVLNGANKPIYKRTLKIFDKFKELIKSRKNPLKIIGNKRYLVFEICSIIFVYTIKKTEFTKSFFKVIRKSDDYGSNEDDFDTNFLNDHRDTKLDLYDYKLAMVHPATSTLFITDLNTKKTYKELQFSSKKCIVDSIKCSDYRLMIGVTKMKKNDKLEHLAIIYHMKGVTQDNRLKIPLLGPVSQFKVTSNCIGVENTGSATPFITKIDSYLKVFWLECNTFSFDCTRKHIYYNVNQSIFQYDLLKSMLSKFEVVQKIAIDAISNLLPLTPINDRYLLVRSTYPNSYDIFDVKDHISVRSIKLTAGYSLVHVGKLSIVFSNSKEFMVIAFN